MTHPSIDQLKALSDSLNDVSLDANARIQVLQKIRQLAANLYINGLQDPSGSSDQIDLMVLEAIEAALVPFEHECPGHSNTDAFPATEYSQP
ncbi:MAG: hypothetical protein ACN6RK_07895 [Stenotrophomonas sp.]